VEPLITAPFGPGLSGWRVLWNRLNPFAAPRPLPGVIDVLSRSTGLSQVRHHRATVANDHIDLLMRPPVAGVGVLDFKRGVALIDTGYRHAAEALSKSGLAKRYFS
jgi:predicted acylesterase/phospholipase RssA